MSNPENRLSGETSPYLLQHADNPVNWYPWGEEALALARRAARENDLILVTGSLYLVGEARSLLRESHS